MDKLYEEVNVLILSSSPKALFVIADYEGHWIPKSCVINHYNEFDYECHQVLVLDKRMKDLKGIEGW